MRLRRTVEHSKKNPLLILMDERYDKLDERMSRMIFSAVEADAEDVRVAKQVLPAIKETLSEGQKFHFASLDSAAQRKIIEVISKMDIRCKIYIFYAIDVPESDMKISALTWSIENTMKNLSKQNVLTFLIEDAEQYGQLIRSDNLISDTALTIIPDAFCYAFARRLDAKMTLNRYNALHDKIRLESYRVKGGCIRKMRGDRLPEL